jgi:ubiquinol-cytochrome c reductase cytochrome c subunit
MTRWTATALLAAIAMLACPGEVQAQPQSGIVRPTFEPARPSIELGKELFAGNCASCHGIGAQGITSPRPGAGGILGEGPSLRNVGARAPDLYLRSGYMPLGAPHDQPWNDRVLFSDKEIRSLVTYVASLGSGPGIPHPDPAQGNLSAGMELFTLHCAGCHQEDAEGGFVTGARVPPLQGVSPTQIAEAVRIGPYEMPRYSTTQISNAQLNSIIRYVLSTRHLDNRGGWRIGSLGPIPEGLVAWGIGIPLLLLSCRVLGRRKKAR